jgi:2-keto-4-pentenoate hydratase/2-oxohepta-3-ene-1,7-dioic acid hydratase in catechol pathway
MRVARYVAAGADPAFGLVELDEDHGEHPGTITRLTGDPLAGPVEFSGERVLLADVRLVAPVLPRSKIIGIGKNYADHIAEMKTAVPEGILTFFKPNTSVIGPDDAIVHPTASSELSYEGELAVVIGRICKQVPIERAHEVIFGYTVGNDVTARDWQRADGQWARAKGSDTFCPLGPWIVTHLTIEEASDLSVRTLVDGQIRQDGTTSQMIHGIAELVAYCSSFTTLLPGDVILTGTPAGVGTVTPGQRIEVSIDQVGTLINAVVAEEA